MIDLAKMFGKPPEAIELGLLTCNDVIQSEQFVAARQGRICHLAIKLTGLGGRKVMRECRKVLRKWFEAETVLFAPIKHGNDKAIRVVEHLGFKKDYETITHVWMRQTRSEFHDRLS